MNNIKFDKTFFLKSVIDCYLLKEFFGVEIAFLGYSNSGKSSIINCLTNKKKLARVSKLPGRTRTINFFHVCSNLRIVDFPGYGYSKIDICTKKLLQKNLIFYLKNRQCLKGIVIMSDIRASLKTNDEMILKIMKYRLLPVLIVLTKSDKISKQQEKVAVLNLQTKISYWRMNITVCSFSKYATSNISLVINTLSLWYFNFLYR